MVGPSNSSNRDRGFPWMDPSEAVASHPVRNTAEWFKRSRLSESTIQEWSPSDVKALDSKTIHSLADKIVHLPAQGMHEWRARQIDGLSRRELLLLTDEQIKQLVTNDRCLAQHFHGMCIHYARNDDWQHIDAILQALQTDTNTEHVTQAVEGILRAINDLDSVSGKKLYFRLFDTLGLQLTHSMVRGTGWANHFDNWVLHNSEIETTPPEFAAAARAFCRDLSIPKQHFLPDDVLAKLILSPGLTMAELYPRLTVWSNENEAKSRHHRNQVVSALISQPTLEGVKALGALINTLGDVNEAALVWNSVLRYLDDAYLVVLLAECGEKRKSELLALNRQREVLSSTRDQMEHLFPESYISDDYAAELYPTQYCTAPLANYFPEVFRFLAAVTLRLDFERWRIDMPRKSWSIVYLLRKFLKEQDSDISKLIADQANTPSQTQMWIESRAKLDKANCFLRENLDHLALLINSGVENLERQVCGLASDGAYSDFELPLLVATGWIGQRDELTRLADKVADGSMTVDAVWENLEDALTETENWMSFHPHAHLGEPVVKLHMVQEARRVLGTDRKRIESKLREWAQQTEKEIGKVERQVQATWAPIPTVHSQWNDVWEKRISAISDRVSSAEDKLDCDDAQELHDALTVVRTISYNDLPEVMQVFQEQRDATNTRLEHLSFTMGFAAPLLQLLRRASAADPDSDLGKQMKPLIKKLPSLLKRQGITDQKLIDDLIELVQFRSELVVTGKKLSALRESVNGPTDDPSQGVMFRLSAQARIHPLTEPDEDAVLTDDDLAAEVLDILMDDFEIYSKADIEALGLRDWSDIKLLGQLGNGSKPLDKVVLQGIRAEIDREALVALGVTASDKALNDVKSGLDSEGLKRLRAIELEALHRHFAALYGSPSNVKRKLNEKFPTPK